MIHTLSAKFTIFLGCYSKVFIMVSTAAVSLSYEIKPSLVWQTGVIFATAGTACTILFMSNTKEVDASCPVPQCAKEDVV